MKNFNMPFAALVVVGLMGLAFLVGCCNQCREKVVTYDVTKTGENWAESKTVQERRGPSGRVEVDKQSVYEEISCVRNGVKIAASSQEACIKAGGKVVDNVIVDEESYRNRR